MGDDELSIGASSAEEHFDGNAGHKGRSHVCFYFQTKQVSTSFFKRHVLQIMTPRKHRILIENQKIIATVKVLCLLRQIKFYPFDQHSDKLIHIQFRNNLNQKN